MPDFETREMDRRMANIAEMGVVEEVRLDNPPRARVRIGPLLTGWLRMGTTRAGDAHQSWPYSEGEEVLVISTAGDFAEGAILCALANSQNQAEAEKGGYRVNFPDGASLHIKDGTVQITAPGKISIEGDVIVAGDVVADGISLKAHKHGDVRAGTSKTGVPQ